MCFFIARLSLSRICKLLAAAACVGFGNTQEVPTTTSTCAASTSYKLCTKLPDQCQGREFDLTPCYTHEFTMDASAYPRLVDWDDDGDLDLVVSDTDGKVLYYEMNAQGNYIPNTTLDETGLYGNPFHEVNAGNRIAAPAFFDWDGDGDKDVLVTSAAGEIYYYEHIGNRDKRSKQIVQKFGDENPFQSIRLDEDISPVVLVVDWNSDNVSDLIVSYPYRGLVYYQQVSGKFVKTPEAENPFRSVPSATYASPEVVDWDGDGDLDLILSSATNGLLYFEQLYDNSLLANPGFFDNLEVGDDASIQVADMNGDGVLDILVGSSASKSLQYYEQTESGGGRCSPSHVCGGHGICSIVNEVGVCRCLQGRRLADCSGCDVGFFSADGGTNSGRNCTRCPMNDGHVCGRKGYCLDDLKALEASSSEILLHPNGAGTCVCSDPFSGTACDEGECAPGFVETYNDRSGQVECIWKDESTGIMIALNLVLCLMLFFAPYLFSLPCWISDISSRSECKEIVVYTSRHFILECGRVPLVFSGTTVPWLDRPSSTIMGRAVGGRELHIEWPTTSNGDLMPAAHSSIGQVRIARPSGIICSGLFVLPLFVWHGMLAAILLNFLFGSTCELVQSFSGSLFLPGPVLALLAHFVRWRFFSKSELQSELQEYSRKLAVARSNEKPEPCEPGPERAVRAGQICDLSEFFSQRLQLQRNMYYVCPNIVLPLTQRYRLSYAEVAGRGTVSWFISHFWGMPFLDFVTGLKKHARSSSGNSSWRDSCYWICTFSNNQWALELEIPPGRDPTHSSFYKALVSPTCRGTCMMLDEHVTPLRRSWCLFELLLTLQSLGSRQEGEFEGLLLLTPSGVLNTGRASMDTALQIGRELALLRLEDATATEPSDKLMIDEQVQGMPGGFATINRQLKTKISEVLVACASGFNSDMADLTERLNEAAAIDSDTSPVHDL